MWELIRENKRKSWIIFIAMGIFLLLLGYFIGMVWFGPEGALGGVFIALCLWVFLSFMSYSSGDSILLFASRAREITHDVHPQLFNIVEEMKIAAGITSMPKIYIIDEPAPNAFATGRSPESSSIAVTAGLLSRLNRDELQGVIAHEMSHIINRDILYVTFAGVMLGSIVMLSHVFLRSIWYSGSSRRYRSGSRGGGQAQIVILIITVIFAILAPILARLLYFALSRKREYLADASGVRLTRYPEGLASALEKISGASVALASANKVTAPMYITNPLRAKGNGAVNLFSTHPPARERIKILRSMMHGVNYNDYQKAFAAVKGDAAGIMPLSAKRDSQSIAVRKPSAQEPRRETKQKMRDITDIMRVVNKYAFLACLCGLKIKVPPNFTKPKISCPRCGREHLVPIANLKVAAAVLSAAKAAKDSQEAAVKETAQKSSSVYKRKGRDWESFSCSCGQLLHISPLFSGKYISCHKCGRKTEIKN